MSRRSCCPPLTGSLFIFGQPDQYFYNAAFKLKVIALLLLGLNVLLFYTLEARHVLALGPSDDAPLRAKIIAAVSLTLLVSIMLFGQDADVLPAVAGRSRKTLQ